MDLLTEERIKDLEDYLNQLNGIKRRNKRAFFDFVLVKKIRSEPSDQGGVKILNYYQKLIDEIEIRGNGAHYGGKFILSGRYYFRLGRYIKSIQDYLDFFGINYPKLPGKN